MNLIVDKYSPKVAIKFEAIILPLYTVHQKNTYQLTREPDKAQIRFLSISNFLLLLVSSRNELCGVK